MSGEWTPGPRWVGVIDPTSQRPPLRPGHRALGRALTFLLVACVLVSVLKVLMDLYGIALFTRWLTDPSSVVIGDGESYDVIDVGLVALQLLLMLATGLATMTWLYQAYGSREADPALLPLKRWWTIGGWLIPVACLVRPFQLMRDLYRASAGVQPHEPPDARGKYPKGFLRWWGCFLLGLGATTWNVAARYVLALPDVAQLRIAVSLDLVAQVLMIAAAVLFIGVVSSITSNLWRRASSGS